MMDDNQAGPVWTAFESQIGGSTPRPAIFLDRDGVINQNRSDYVKSWEEFEFLPGALNAIAQLASSHFHVIVVTNQSAIGRGIVPSPVVEAIHDRMVREVTRAGGRIDAVVYCPHEPKRGCLCRKPAPGMFHEAVARLPVDLPASVFIGDAQSDLLAARAAGCRPVLVMSGRTTPEMLETWDAAIRDIVVEKDLLTAVTLLLRNE
ncbi:MAG: D-glycero-beta-D-manno-heptose 1,7-bisphosphate 7-phosphatase [Chloroflexi bacterium]|nr:D-glycero-beta-D-manno-heptose 1,7-bisphosphate 7-phosphatase [Chloroflexota bacterium]